MIRKLKQTKIFKELNKSTNASFTLESTFIAPMIFICLFTLLFLALFVYQKVYLQYTSQLTSERVSFTWDNSYKQIETGEYPLEKSDGLYWRLTQDNFLYINSMLNVISNQGTDSNLALPLTNKKQNENLRILKMTKGAEDLSSIYNGKMEFNNGGFERVVTTNLKRPFQFPSFIERLYTLDKMEVKGKSWVVDPVEYIRVIDLTSLYLIPVLKDKISPEQARSLYEEPTNQLNDKVVVIQSEAQAKAYLRTLVSGQSTNMKTSDGKTREIDVLDKNQIAHQTFYTFSESQLLSEQLPKDVDLIRVSQKLKGVVWHFFLRKGKTKIEISESFLRQVRQQGIVVVLHE